MKILFRILCLLLIGGSLKAQSPTGLPSPYSPTSYYHVGWVQEDSGHISAFRDTSLRPKYIGTEIVWMHAGSDTSKWIWVGKWVKELKQGDVIGGVSSFNTRTGAITLTSSDVTTALGGTPLFNITNYLTAGTNITITGLGTLASPYNINSSGGGSAGVTQFSFTNGNGFTGTVTNSTTTPNLSLGTSLTGIVNANGSGFSTVTIGSGLNYTGGVLTATGGTSLTGLISANGAIFTTASIGAGLSFSGNTLVNTINNTNQLTNGSGFISNVTGLVTAGTGVTITGLGTSGSPYVINASGSSSGSVTNFSAGNLSPLFTTSVTNPTTIPGLTFTLTNAPANSVFGNNTGSSSSPAYYVPNATTLNGWYGATLLTVDTAVNAGLWATKVKVGTTIFIGVDSAALHAKMPFFSDSTIKYVTPTQLLNSLVTQNIYVGPVAPAGYFNLFYKFNDSTLYNRPIKFFSPLIGQSNSDSTFNVIIDTATTATGIATIYQVGLKQNLVTLTTSGSGAATFNQVTGALNIPVSSGAAGANPTGTIGLTAVNGSATTFLRSDGAPALSQSIVPTWTGKHIFNVSPGLNALNTATGTPRILVHLTDSTVGQLTIGSGLSVSAGSLVASGAVSSVTNADGTITFSPTTGAVVGSLALGHANTWTAAQTVNAAFVTNSTVTLSGVTYTVGGATFDVVVMDTTTGILSRQPYYQFDTTGFSAGNTIVNYTGTKLSLTAVAGGGSGANPTASVGLSAVNGTATTFLRSDGAPALSQAIVPTWTGKHIFNVSPGLKALNTATGTPTILVHLTDSTVGQVAIGSNLSVSSGSLVATIPLGANPSASIGLSAVNGSATTFMRSDGAPALSQSIVPTWTGKHSFSVSPGLSALTTATGTPTILVHLTDSTVGQLTVGSGLSVSAGALTAVGSSGANPSASVGLSAVNGSATTFMRSDGAPALSQSIVPTWSGKHTFSVAPVLNALQQSAASAARSAILIHQADSSVQQLTLGAGTTVFHGGTVGFATVNVTTDISGVTPPGNGGTGINNGSSTITLGGNLTTSGAFTTTLTVTANTNVTLPISGTLVNTAVTTLSSLVSIGTISTGVWNGTAITVPFGGTGRASNTAYGLIAGGTTTTGNLQNIGTGTSGQFLQSQGSSALPTWVTATSYTSGSYTPTVVTSTDVTTATPGVAFYHQIGSIVTVTGTFTVQVTTANATAIVVLSLPFTTTFSAGSDLSGVASLKDLTANTRNSGVVYAYTTSPYGANIEFVLNNGTNTYQAFYTYTYFVVGGL